MIWDIYLGGNREALSDQGATVIVLHWSEKHCNLQLGLDPGLFAEIQSFLAMQHCFAV
jgi:hypothetical protein